MSTTTIHTVTLWPYEDAAEAHYQFDSAEDAQAFADRVNALPRETLRYLTGTGKPTPVVTWRSSTYDTVDAAWAALADYLPECRHVNVDPLMDALDPARETTDTGTCRDCGAAVHLEPTEDGDRYWEAD